MTLNECYDRLGGSYDEIFGRFKSDALINRFLPMFLKDKSFEDLTEALNSGDTEAAFRAAHTLKGVCANLALTKLYNSACEITEMLRSENLEDAKEYFPAVKADYELTFNAITLYSGEM